MTRHRRKPGDATPVKKTPRVHSIQVTEMIAARRRQLAEPAAELEHGQI
jgi:hypothetical protein